MKKLIFGSAVAFASVVLLIGATVQNIPLSDMTRITPTADDLTYVVDNPGGTPLSRAATFQSFAYLITEWAGMGYNVKAHGAVGNGTTDDTAAIQATIDLAEAAGSGKVIVPHGTYRIATGPINIEGGGITIECEGGPSGNIPVTNPLIGTGFLTSVGTNAIFRLQDGLEQSGPAIIGCIFAGTGAGARSAIGIESHDHNGVRIERSAFLSLAKGIYLTGVTDNSNWIVCANEFRDNVIAIDGGTTPSDNTYCNNYIFPTTLGDKGIYLGVGSSGIQIFGNHIACSGTLDYQTGVEFAGTGASIFGNFFESCTPNVAITGSGSGDSGRGLKIIGNTMTGLGLDGELLTCTRTSGSPILTGCGSTTPIRAGMVVQGTGIPTPFTYGSDVMGAQYSEHILSGAVRVNSIDSASQLTMSENATASGTTQLTFCHPMYRWPSTWGVSAGYQVVVIGNSYIAFGCSPYFGWDGG